MQRHFFAARAIDLHETSCGRIGLGHCGGIDRLPTASCGVLRLQRADRQARFCDRRRRQEPPSQRSVRKRAGGRVPALSRMWSVYVCLQIRMRVWCCRRGQTCSATTAPAPPHPPRISTAASPHTVTCQWSMGPCPPRCAAAAPGTHHSWPPTGFRHPGICQSR